MSSCTKPIPVVSGTAKGKKLHKVILTAFRHLLSNGQQECNGGCDSGRCTFGLTGISDDIQIIADADGDRVTVTVSGSGACFCSDE